MVYTQLLSQFLKLHKESTEFEMNENNFNNKFLFTEESQRE